MADYKDMIIKVVGERVSFGEWKVRTGKHEIFLSKGGAKFPSPNQCLLTALAGCFLSVGEIVALEKGITIDDLRVVVEGTLNLGKVYGEEGQRAGLKGIKVKVQLKSEVDQETLNKWLGQVEERCPVSDNLINPTPLVIEVERF